jgi:hypothetical protein
VWLPDFSNPKKLEQIAEAVWAIQARLQSGKTIEVAEETTPPHRETKPIHPQRLFDSHRAVARSRARVCAASGSRPLF